MSEILEKINSYVWGNGLIFLLLITGIIFTIKLGFIQLKLPKFLIRNTKTQNSGLSQFKTVCMSLGTTMGTGNITGAASALAIGGAGSDSFSSTACYYVYYYKNYNKSYDAVEITAAGETFCKSVYLNHSAHSK